MGQAPDGRPRSGERRKRNTNVLPGTIDRFVEVRSILAQVVEFRSVWVTAKRGQDEAGESRLILI